jgi:2-keto-4-pentenoate hydratase/2-oxohepta-3-ene-1,7-dioic acid hydratase in catechol pathway
MIAYVSQSETLYAGEFFGSGTATVPESGKSLRCCGLEMGHFLKVGDRVELEVERIGTLTNYIVTSSQPLSQNIDSSVGLPE